MKGTQRNHKDPAPGPPSAPDKGRPVGMIALILSVLSLFISVLSLWVNSLSPANITVSVDSPALVVRADESKPGNFNFGFRLTCVFVNKGASSGVVQDILARVGLIGGDTEALYNAMAVIDERQALQGPTLPDLASLKELFHPIPVQGKSSVVATLLFVGVGHNPNFRFSTMQPGRYKFTVLLRAAGQTGYVSNQSFTVNLSQEEFISAAKGTTVFVIPEELDRARSEVR